MLAVIMVLGTSKPAFAAESAEVFVNYSVRNENEDLLKLFGEEVSQEQSRRVKAELEVLESFCIDKSNVSAIILEKDGNKYVMEYDGICETISIEKDSSGNRSLTICAGNKRNEISFGENGILVLDGNEIKITDQSLENENSGISPRGTIWKGVKSLSPYGSLKESDYDDFLASGKQNVALGKALDELTITALSAVIGSLHSYLGIAVSLAGVAEKVYNVLVKVNPKTEYLGCTYTTYIAGASDYKYINKFYSNAECTGKYRREVSYEHFTVY